jgi:hypothetical protein
LRFLQGGLIDGDITNDGLLRTDSVGQITGDLTNAGFLSFDDKAATSSTLTVNGDFTQTADGFMFVTMRNTDIDSLKVFGTATLAGKLKIDPYKQNFNPDAKSVRKQ